MPKSSVKLFSLRVLFVLVMLGVLLGGNSPALVPVFADGGAGNTFLPVILRDYDGTSPPPTPGGPTITTPSPLPAGTLGVNYSQTLQASGGTVPYAWAITGSALLPTGVSLDNATGVISGIPVNTGTASFQVKVTDANTLYSIKDFNLTVNPATQSGAPAPPDDLTYTSLLTTSIGLTWKDNSNNETYFEIWRAKDQMIDYSSYSISVNNVWEDTGLTPDTLYCYKVRAQNNSGDSEFTNTFCAWTETDVKPRPPSNVTCKVISKTEVLVNWTNNSYSEKYQGCIELDGVEYCAGDINEPNIEGWVVYDISIMWSKVRAKIRAYNVQGIPTTATFPQKLLIPEPRRQRIRYG